MEKMSQGRPNVLWICTDQQRGDTVGALGNRHIRTPNLDRLVAEGTAFTRAYCQSPVCTPSRASFLTGRYASAVLCSRNGNPVWPEAAPLVTKVLKDSGYDCGLAGKLHLADPRKPGSVLGEGAAIGHPEPRPRDDGYRVFEWSHNQKDLWPQGHAYADWVKEQGENLGELRERLGYIPSELHQTRWCADRAIEFLTRGKQKSPWLFSVNFFDPHPPFDPPPDYEERYPPEELPGPAFRESDVGAQALLTGVDFPTKGRVSDASDALRMKARYYAMIEQIDHHVGRILEALKTSGQEENTLVIFMSDHGEMLGDHGLVHKGCRFYEGLVRVPLITRWPGVVKGGAVRNDLVELSDLAPTLLDFSGSAEDPNMTGRSLRAVLCDGAKHFRRAVRCEYYGATLPNKSGRKHYRGSHGTMYRTERYKLVTYHGHPMGELFDLERDPQEFENLWSDPAYRERKHQLLSESFDATVQGLEPIPGRSILFEPAGDATGAP